MGVSGGGGVDEVGGDRVGTASARLFGLDEEKEVEVEVVVGGMRMDLLELRLVWMMVGERERVWLELRVLLFVGVRGMSSFESSVVEVVVVLVVVFVLSGGLW